MSTQNREVGRIYSESEIAKQAELDKIMLEEKWNALDKALEDLAEPELRADIISALKELYDIYIKEAIDWYAGLYDPSVGGYYYSNSARDNARVMYDGKYYELLPDLESTCQAMGVISSSHMADKFDGDIASALPEWMKEQIVTFVKKMQDEKNGYFYHPQWGRELTDTKIGRRGRDLTWAIRTLDRYGEKPLYKSPLEDRSEDKKARNAETSPHLRNKKSFEDYLNSLGFDSKNAYSAYLIGNALESQVTEIVARDKELEKEGADYRLLSVMKEWFDSRFNKKNGSWTTAPLCYDVCNCILKISSTYVRAGLSLPEPIKSIKAVIKCMALDQKPIHVCDILNTWYALNTIVSSVKESGKDIKILNEMRREIIEHYPEMVRKTTENLKIFLKPDGSFSYFPDRSADRSQDMPVALPHTNEGDMNATMICNVAIPSHIFGYLGLTSVPIYTESDRMRYINVLEKNKAKL